MGKTQQNMTLVRNHTKGRQSVTVCGREGSRTHILSLRHLAESVVFDLD